MKITQNGTRAASAAATVYTPANTSCFTMLYDAEENEEEASLVHKGESSSSDLSESSDNEDEDDDRTNAKEIYCNGDGNGGGDRKYFTS